MAAVRPGQPGRLTLAEPGHRPAVPADEGRRPGRGGRPAAAQQPEAGGRAPEGPGHEQPIPRPGPRAEEGGVVGATVTEGAEHGHRDHQDGRFRQIAPHHHAGRPPRGLGHPRSQPVEVGARGSGDRDQGVVRPGPHGGQVGHRDHQRLVAHVVVVRQVEVHMDPLDHQIGGHDGPGPVGIGPEGRPRRRRRRSRCGRWGERIAREPGPGRVLEAGPQGPRWRRTRRAGRAGGSRNPRNWDSARPLAYHCGQPPPLQSENRFV